MARMQRKKTETEKKKKRPSQSEETLIETTDAPSETSGISAVKATEKKKSLQPSRPAPAAKPSILEGDGKIAQWVGFLREVKVELGKVVWPTRKQTIGSTVVVIILVILLSAFLGAVDFCLSGLMRYVI